MEIDWSKAPEGATHYDTANSRISSFMKLEGGSWFFWPPSSSGPQWTFWRPDTVDVEAMIPRPPAATWTGEGRPPVGTVCEFQHRNAPNGIWHPTTIRFSSHAHIIYVDSIENCEACYVVNDSCRIDFRPVRTPEQIAAEEREKTIAELKKVFDSISHELCQTSNKYLETLFGAIHDAGWKQVAP